MKEQLYVDKLSKMIEVETINNGSAKDLDKFKKYQKVLEELFPHVFKTFKKEIFHGSMLLSYEVDSPKKPVCFMSHQDVVPENGEWTSDAFHPEVREGKLYGRGTLDTKGNFFAFTEAIEELLEDNYTFTRSIYIVSSCNEETTSDGIREIVDYLSQKNIHFDFVMDEGGMIIDNLFGDKKQKLAMVALGEKRCTNIKFSIAKHGGHASNPGTDSSLLALTRFIQDVNKYKGFITYFEPTNEEMLRLVSSSCHGFKKFLFKHSHAFKPFIAFLFKRLSSSTRAMIRTTLCFTCIHGSDAYNVIPEVSYVIANIRISHHEGYESCVNKLRKIADKHHVTMEVIDEGYTSKLSSYKSEQFAYLRSIVSSSFDNVIALPYIANVGSDSRYMDKVCDNVFRFAPFIISDEQLGSIHGINENIDTKTLEPGVEFYKNMIRGL